MRSRWSPRAASARASAAPMPDDAPVTSAAPPGAKGTAASSSTRHCYPRGRSPVKAPSGGGAPQHDRPSCGSSSSPCSRPAPPRPRRAARRRSGRRIAATASATRATATRGRWPGSRAAVRRHGAQRDVRRGRDVAFYLPFGGYYRATRRPACTCPPSIDRADLRAEIWRYTPGRAAGGASYGRRRSANPRARRTALARDIGYRGMVVARGPPEVALRRRAQPGRVRARLARPHPPRLLRSTDGGHFRAAARPARASSAPRRRPAPGRLSRAGRAGGGCTSPPRPA